MHLDEWVEDCLANQQQRLRQTYLEVSELLGQNVRIAYQQQRYSGRVVDLDPFQGILVQLDHGGVRLFEPAGTTLLP
jgi:biotin-(acetyl-CoA carboxylase) ligase